MLKTTTLENGITVISEHVSGLRSFALGVWLDVGSRHENASQHGAAHFIEHLVFRGTAGMRSRSVANKFEQLGSYVNAFTTKEHTCFYAHGLAERSDAIASLLLDIVFHPGLRDADVEKEREVIIEELLSAEDEVEEIIYDMLDEELFGKHPMAHPIGGTPASLELLSAEALRAFHKAKYVGVNTVVSAAGAFEHEALVALVRRWTGDISAGRRSKTKPPTLAGPRHRMRSKNIQQTHIAMGRLIPIADEKMRYSMSMLSFLFGEGLSSRLHQNVRERHGVAYAVSSGTADYSDVEAFTLYAACDPAKAARTEHLLLSEMRLLRDKGVKKAEVERAREQIKTNEVVALETMSSRMTGNAKDWLYYRSPGRHEHSLRLLDSVSRDDVTAIVEAWFDADEWSMVVVRPGQEQEEEAR